MAGEADGGWEAEDGYMRYLSIGADTRLARIGLGTWQFGSRGWGYGESYARHEARAIVRRALELGVNLFDTAELYGFGRSERILGEALGEDRESAFIATKIFPVLPVAPVVEQRAGIAPERRDQRLDPGEQIVTRDCTGEIETIEAMISPHAPHGIEQDIEA